MRRGLRKLIAVWALVSLSLVLTACKSEDASERAARTFLEAVRKGDSVTYDAMLDVPSSEDSATAAGVMALSRAISGGYKIDHVTPLEENYSAVFVHVTYGDSDPGFFETLTISDPTGDAKVDTTYSSALEPGAFK